MSIRTFALAAMLSACAGSPVRPQGGEMIAVHFANTPLPDALDTIAHDAHITIDAADPAVSATGTVTLDMHAPWKFVLARVARDHALHVRYQGPPDHPTLAVVSTTDAPPLTATNPPGR